MWSAGPKARAVLQDNRALAGGRGHAGSSGGRGMDVGYGGGVAGESVGDQILKDSGRQAHQFGQIKNLRLRKAIYWTH